MLRITFLGFLFALQSAAIVCEMHFDSGHSETALTEPSHPVRHIPGNGVCEDQFPASIRISIEPQVKFVFVVHMYDLRQMNVDAKSLAAILPQPLFAPFASRSAKPALPILRI